MDTYQMFRFCIMIFQLWTFALAQDFSTLNVANNQHGLLVAAENEPALIAKVGGLGEYQEMIDRSGIVDDHEGFVRSQRDRRQVTLNGNSYVPPVVTDLHASQHCHGIYLRWKIPPLLRSTTKTYSNSEFLYYNVYRSAEYFSRLDGMTPYAFGRDHFELRFSHNVSWVDRDPVANKQMWYAVTIVTRAAKEMQQVAPAKAMFIGAFGPHGSKIPLTASPIRGRVLHHTAIYNGDRNEYFVVYDVDSNLDGQPDRIFALRMTPAGSVVRKNILDISVNVNAASQGWPSVAYNPIRSEYFVVFQLRSARILSGISFLVGSRIFAASFKLVTNPTLLLKTNQNKNGKLVNVPVTNARVLYNHRNHGYIVLGEAVGLEREHFVVLHYTDSDLKGIQSSVVFPGNARSGRLAIDTKRNELYIIAQVPRRAFAKASAPKLLYAIIVKKRSLSGAVLPTGEIVVKAGETRLLRSSVSCFYDAERDRLVIFWNDMIAGKQVVKSSRVIIQGPIGVAEVLGSYESQTCSAENLRAPFVEMFPKTSGQLLVGEKYTRSGVRLSSPLIKDEAFEYRGLNQKAPILVSNKNGDQVLLLWQEVRSGRQSSLYARVLKATQPTCSSCVAPKVCKQQSTCELPSKGTNPCAKSNAGCNQICLRSYDGAKCACKDGFDVGFDKRTCKKSGNVDVSLTIVTASVNDVWKTNIMTDSSLKTDLLFRGKGLSAIFFDEKADFLYWSDVDSFTISRARLDGTDSEIFVSNVQSDGIYADSESGKIFWTDFLNKRIDVSNSEYKSTMSLVTSGVDKPRAITFFKKDGAAYLYWTDWGSISKIERVQLDDGLSVAGNRRVIVGNGLEWPNGLAADAPNDRLYWADAKLDKIETSDLLGNGRRTLSSISPVHPFAIVIYQNSIYWSDWAGAVKKADKSTGLNEEEVFSGIIPRGFYIFKHKASKCPKPSKPLNGNRNVVGYNVNDAVIYTCNPGYKLIGSNRRRCMPGGAWSGSEPKCLTSKCPKPSKPLNGNRNVVGYNVNDAVIYTCNPGYKLIGSNRRRCMPGGAWSGSEPKCLTLPVFRKVPQNETTFIGKSVSFSCDAVGSGKIKTRWLKDGIPLEYEKDRTLVVHKILFIIEAKLSDSGEFTCVASNEAGEIKASAVLRVVKKIRGDCGIPKFSTRQRIFGGRNAGAGAHPWIAMFWDKARQRPLCGGTLIADKFIITAAHCLRVGTIDNIDIKVGKMKARKAVEPHEQVRRIKTVHSHPRFNAATYDSDIAVVELDVAVTLTDYVIPICLPYDDSDYDLIATGETAVVIGWGASRKSRAFSRKLKEVDLPIIDRKKCQEKMSYPVTENMFCAGGGGHKDACKGDSGGPITMQNHKSKKHVLIGLVSWGESCGSTRHYGIYVKLFNFLSWVYSIVD